MLIMEKEQNNQNIIELNCYLKITTLSDYLVSKINEKQKKIISNGHESFLPRHCVKWGGGKLIVYIFSLLPRGVEEYRTIP